MRENNDKRKVMWVLGGVILAGLSVVFWYGGDNPGPVLSIAGLFILFGGIWVMTKMA